MWYVLFPFDFTWFTQTLFLPEYFQHLFIRYRNPIERMASLSRLLQRCNTITTSKNQSFRFLETYFTRHQHCATNNQLKNQLIANSSQRDSLLQAFRFNKTIVSIHNNILANVASLRGKKLRQFKNLYRQFFHEIRLLKNEDKVPEGFGKFFPKGKPKQPTPEPPKEAKPREKPKEIEFKFSFGGSKTGGSGGGGKPSDPNMLSLIGFGTTIAVLSGFLLFKSRWVSPKLVSRDWSSLFADIEKSLGKTLSINMSPVEWWRSSKWSTRNGSE